jgi:predicted metal-dependent hydrolase
MRLEELEKLLAECKKLVGYDGPVRIALKPYKLKAATANIKSRTITVNTHLLDLGEDVIRYLLVHELVHLKLNSRYHDSVFHEELLKVVPEDEVRRARHMIIERLLEINNVRRGRRSSGPSLD